MDNPIHAKGQQTVDEVVDTALRGVRQGRTRIISGLTNYITATAVNVDTEQVDHPNDGTCTGPRYRETNEICSSRQRRVSSPHVVRATL